MDIDTRLPADAGLWLVEALLHSCSYRAQDVNSAGRRALSSLVVELDKAEHVLPDEAADGARADPLVKWSGRW
jgi:hypothetical protein